MDGVPFGLLAVGDWLLAKDQKINAKMQSGKGEGRWLACGGVSGERQ